jgi:hypothetical protein
MVGSLFKIIIGLFIWMVVPRLIYKKRKSPKNMLWGFINLSCKIVGFAIIATAILNFLQTILS